MTYMLLIYSPNIGRDRTEDEWAQMAEPFFAYNEYVKASGYYVDGAPLAELGSATTVRVRDGKRVVSDGPFAETKEFLGGYYIVDCPSIDQAIELAAACPAAAFASVEVRPVMNMPAAADAG